MLRVQEEALIIEHRRTRKGFESYTKKLEVWTEEVNALLNERNLKIRNEKPRVKFTKNPAIMDKTARHVKMKGLSEDFVDQINQVRLHKRFYFP